MFVVGTDHILEKAKKIAKGKKKKSCKEESIKKRRKILHKQTAEKLMQIKNLTPLPKKMV
jgi:hypothetical protein